jgi:hypothetical protein
LAQVAHPAASASAPAAVAAPPPESALWDLSVRTYRTAVAACVGGAAAFLAFRLTAWPPHEDETLALFVGQGSLRSLLGTVLGERGGAPLHFVFAWMVSQLGGGIGGLRLVSALFALASIPLVAALAERLAGRTEAALAALLASASWVLLFHAVYGRMYSLFLFTSALSYLALLAALRGGGGRRWTLWAVTILLTVATHPYGALVLASQGVFVLLARERLREAFAAFGAVVVAGIPFWITDLVLAGRFDVGVGGEGGNLGGPVPVVRYLGRVAADFSAGAPAVPIVLVLLGLGFVLLRRTNRRGALLVAATFATPTGAFLLARLGQSAAPETRHLIFTLPFFATLLAVALAAIARSGRQGAPAAAGATAALLAVGSVAWAWERTPSLFLGEPRDRIEARAELTSWLERTGRADDVLLGYDPVFLSAWQRSPTFSRLVLPRADARLAASTLRRAGRPLGRGIWVFNAAAATNLEPKGDIPLRFPRPAEAFEARTFGPYLVLRTRKPTRTPHEYLRVAAGAMVLGKTLLIGDADINFQTMSRAAMLLGYEASPNVSRSTSSR